MAHSGTNTTSGGGDPLEHTCSGNPPGHHGRVVESMTDNKHGLSLGRHMSRECCLHELKEVRLGRASQGTWDLACCMHDQ